MKKLIVIVSSVLLASCTLEQEMDLVEVRALFAYNDTCGQNAYNMIVEIDGDEYMIYPEYIEIGLRGNFYAPKGRKEITRAEVYDAAGNQIYYNKPMEEVGSHGGQLVVGLPYEFEDYLVLQLWCTEN